MTNVRLDWLDKKEYPFDNKYFMINGQGLHYIDEGKGEAILFVHGTPSWSFDFRHQIKALSKNYRCIAIDHIGFGLSDKPSKYDYSTQNHAKTLGKFIEHLQLDDFTLVVHDFGGVIGFDYALKNPNHIKQIIVLNSWLWDCSKQPEYIKLKQILKNPLLPFLYKWLNFSPRFLMPQSFGNKKKLSKTIHQQYLAPFAKIGQRMGTLAFARSLLNDQAWFGTLWDKTQLLREKPILLIWGMQDSFVLPSNLDKFASAFSQTTIVKIADCGHFPQEEASEIVLEAMEKFLKNS
jgi:haloalkane dehalogenase